MQTSIKPNAGKNTKTSPSPKLGSTPSVRREPPKVFRTVLVPSCGWPTEDSVPKKHTRAKR